MANNTDIDFANKLREIMAFLFENVDSPDRKEAYDIGIKLLNVRFGACPKCGHVNSGGKFCAECGQQLAGEVVNRENENLESVDFLIAKKTGNNLHVFAIADDEQSALASLRHQLNCGVSAEMYKRTVERVKVKTF